MSSAYLSLLIFLLAILIPASASSSPAFWMRYSVFKLNKQGDNIQLWCTPFLIWIWSLLEPVCRSMSSSNCCFFTCIQISQEAGQVVWYSHVLKNIPQFVVILTSQEKTLESPLECKEINPVHLKRNKSWIFIGRTDVEAETPILWPPDEKSWLIWKDLDAGKDWRQEEKGMTEDEVVGGHHWLYGHEFE